MEPECPHTFTKQGNPECCWYCNTQVGDTLLEATQQFSVEWDTPVHFCCIRKALKLDPTDQEAQIFAEEFDLSL